MHTHHQARARRVAHRSVFAILLCTPAVHAQTLTDPRLRADLVAQNLGSGFSTLVNSAAFLDHDTLIYASRAGGVIRRLDLIPGSVVEPGPIVHDLAIITAAPGDGQSEYGVQGIALHPSFASNGWVYIRYDQSIAPPADTPQSSVTEFVTPMVNVTERFIWDDDLNGGAGGLVFNQLIRSAPIQTRVHHGGPHAFGPDGKLYTLFGDQRLSSQTAFNGLPNLFSFSDISIISRLNDDGTIPASNPFGLGSGSPDPIATASWFAYGLRNPFGMMFDPVTGALWISDNGESTFDEINRVPMGANSGATRIFGPINDPRQAGNAAQLVNLPGSTYIDPQFSWWRTCGVTGMTFLSDSALGAAYDDRMIVGNYNSGYLWMLRLSADRQSLVFTHPGLQAKVDDRPSYATNPIGTPAEELLLGTGFGGTFSGTVLVLRSPDGWPYVLTATGRLYRISRACPADVVGIGSEPGADGQLTVDDIIAFINTFSDGVDCPGAPGTGPCSIADITGIGGPPTLPDGELTVDDIITFFNAFSDGC